MAKDEVTTEQTDETRDDELDTGRDETDVDGDETDDDEPEVDPAVLKSQLDKVQRKANRRDAELRKAQARIKELEGKGEAEDAPDPVAIANTRIVRNAAKVALAEVGVKREDMADVLQVLNLSGIQVDDEGEVDEDELADLIGRLRTVFASPVKAVRSPRMDTRDRGGKAGATVDPDSSRYKNFLGRTA